MSYSSSWNYRNITLLFSILGFSYCQNINEIDVNDDLKKLGLDPNLEDRLNQTKLPKMEDVENALRQKCEKLGAGNAVDQIKVSLSISLLVKNSTPRMQFFNVYV